MSIVIPVNTASYDAVSRRMEEAAARAPRPPPRAALVRCPWCSETVEPRVARIAGWVLATLDAVELLFSSRTCLVLFNQRAPTLGKPTALLVDEAAPEARTWSDVPTRAPGALPGAGERRPFRFVCAADSRHAMTVHRELQADGSWSPDAARLLALAGWVQVGAVRVCGKTCAGSARNASPPIPAVERLNDVSWQPSARQQPPTERERSMAREVPDRPADRPARGKASR